MFRTYVAMGMLALSVFTYAQYTGISAFSEEPTRSAPAQRGGATHK